MEDLSFGIVGCGGRGSTVANIMTKTKGVRLVAVCDVIPERSRKLGEQLNVTSFTNFDEMLDQVPIDAVFIASPVEHHFTAARTAILHGKHVIVEKMMSTSAAEAWELVRLTEIRGVCGAVCYQLRFYPVFQLWREIVLSLQPLLITCSRNPGIMPPAFLRSEPWAGIVDFLTHDLDLVIWVMGNEPETVMATVFRKSVTDTDALDTLCVTLNFNGAIGIVYGSMGGWGMSNLHGAIGCKGNARIVGNYVEVNRIEKSVDGHYERISDMLECQEMRTDSTNYLLEHFSGWVQGEKDAPPLATFEDGLKVMLVHEAIEASWKTEQPVSVESVKHRLVPSSF